MKILDRYLARELLGPFLFGVGAFVTIFVASNLLFRLTKLVAEEGITFGQAGLLFLYWLPGFMVLTFPMSTLLAVLLVYSRLSADSELVAARAGGVGLIRLALPAVVVAALVSLFAFGFGETVVPISSRAARDLLLEASKKAREQVQEDVVLRDVEEGRLRRLFYAKRFLPKGKNPGAKDFVLSGVSMIEFSSKRPTVLVSAEQAVWDGKVWKFIDGFAQQLGPNANGWTSAVKFSTQDFDLGRNPEDIIREQREHQEMTFRELRAHIKALAKQGVDVATLLVNLQHKVSIPFSSLVFAFIGIPLGIRSHRSSSSIGLGISILIIFAYYVIWHLLAVFAERGIFSAFWAAWLPNFLGAGIGLGLLVRASK